MLHATSEGGELGKTHNDGGDQQGAAKAKLGSIQHRWYALWVIWEVNRSSQYVSIGISAIWQYKTRGAPTTE